ncbi:hypothetical protein LCGC14_2015960 [marine sediment metagenome]|uniref:Uncharacterized protein n=1 Tax=marine sediment metagenome TaxID=412755 RepID=A0A0F9FLG1_9ZZZZ
MGYYINPRDCTKEEWLDKYGEHINEPLWPPDSKEVFVCLVQNPGFSAAAVVYDEREFKEFQPSSHDTRPRKWYVLRQGAVIGVCPEVESVLA